MPRLSDSLYLKLMLAGTTTAARHLPLVAVGIIFLTPSVELKLTGVDP